MGFEQDSFGQRRERSTTRWVVLAVALVCSIGFIVFAFALRDNAAENDQDDEYQQCLDDERDRIEREGSLLDPEDFCDIYPGKP